MKTVLIVDDAKFMRYVIRRMLSRNGYEIIGEADNGEDAIAQYQALHPDLVTLDITMPRMDGITALKKIREVDEGACVVMLTSMGQEAYVRDAIEAGARGFVVKPFNEKGVLTALNKIQKENQ